MFKKLFDSRIADVKKGLTTFPTFPDIVFSGIVILLFLCPAFVIVFFSDTFTWKPLEKDFLIATLLPSLLILFNAFVEEIFFRGLLLSHKSRNISKSTLYFSSIFSILIFVAWHPFTALCFPQPHHHLFLDPAFLSIVTIMAIACTLTYIKSGSLWIPIGIHWITIVIWIFGFGGQTTIL